MFISQLCKTLFLTTACAGLLLPGAAKSQAQAASPIDYLYVSPQGSDSWSGQFPTFTDGSGPFQTLVHAKDAVAGLVTPGLTRPVEVIVDPSLCSDDDFLSRWFSAEPQVPVIWHSDLERTVLIYTPTLAEQIDALSAEDYSVHTPLIRFYVSPAGNDDWTGRCPGVEAGEGPFRTLERAQEAVLRAREENSEAPVEVVFEVDAAAAKKAAGGAGKASAPKASKYTPAGMAALKALKASHASAASSTPAITARSGAAVTAASAAAAGASPHLVFAHYVMAARDYGGSVAGYEHDIQDAQAAGVDGFALNCGAWNAANYKADTASMFQAAHALNSGFKLFFSGDMSSLSTAELQQMVKAYANDPSYFHYQSRPVVSTWAGDGGGASAIQSNWLNGFLTPMRAAGYNIFFVPQFSDGNAPTTADGATSAVQVTAAYNSWWKNVADSANILDGLFEVSLGSPMSYPYTRTVAPVPVAAGHQAGLTDWDAHPEHYYDPTHEFDGDDVGRTITITGNADFVGGTFLITHIDGSYGVYDSKGHFLGCHNLITLALHGNAPIKHLGATGGGYTINGSSAKPQKSASLLSSEAYAALLHTNGKLFIGSVTPQYWGSLRTNVGREYTEFCGGEGLAAQWNSILTVQNPQWVELFTWNDFAEDTYFSPIDDVAKYWPYALPGTPNNVRGYMKSHAGFTALNSYYINWYKTGVQPATTADSVYYFYRTQPMNMVATNDPLGCVTGHSDLIQDVIYVTVMLKSPATLKVTSGSTSPSYSLPAGTSTLRVPFTPGAQTFTLLRNGQTVLTQQGEPVVASAPTYNFGLYSGCMTNQPATANRKATK